MCYQQRCFSHTGLKMKLLSHTYLVHSQTVYSVLFIYMYVCANTVLFTDEQNKLPEGRRMRGGA